MSRRAYALLVYFSKAAFTIWLLKKKGQLNSVSSSLCFCASRRVRKFAVDIDYFSILLVWEVAISALWGVIYLHLIARFLFYHMDISIWHSRKHHRNFQRIWNSQNANFENVCSASYSVLSKFVLWRLPREYWYMQSCASANNRANAGKLVLKLRWKPGGQGWNVGLWLEPHRLEYFLIINL